LLAVIEADKACDFVFAYGLDHDVFDVIDNGKIKTGADILGMSGYTDSAILYALSRSIIAYESTGNYNAEVFKGINQITKSQVQHVLEERPDVVEYVDKYKKSTVVSPSVSSFCYWLIASAYGKEEAEAYLDMVLLGYGLEPDTIEAYLYNKLQRNKNAPQNKMTKTAIIANIILGWRRYKGLSKSNALQLTWDASRGLPSIV
jgi:hypothetical protein